MRIYLAHNYAAREFLKESIVPVLEREGHIITSRWLYLPENKSEESAERDLDDIDRSDMLLLFGENYGNRPGRGKYVELGYALAFSRTGASKFVAVIGEKKDCVFYSLPDVRVYETFEEFYEFLTERIGLKAK